MTDSRIGVATLSVNSIDKDDEGIIIITALPPNEIGICISLKHGGDPEIAVDLQTAETIISEIEKAIYLVKNTYKV